MVLGRFGGSGKGEDVGALIAKKNYTRAIEVIREQLLTQRNDPRLRLQLGDVLVSAGKDKEAVTILLPLADEFAKDGFAAKAISVLKKVQRIDPGRRDIDSRLAKLIQEKQRHGHRHRPGSLRRRPRDRDGGDRFRAAARRSGSGAGGRADARTCPGSGSGSGSRSA